MPSATEILFALGLGDRVVAVTHECDHPPEAARLPQLTRTVLDPGLSPERIDAEVKRVTAEGRALYALDEERLEQLRPALIVTQAVCEVCAVSYDDVVAAAARLPSQPRVLSLDPATLEEVLADVMRLGDAAGEPQRAVELRAELEGRLAAVAGAVAELPRPRVLALEWLDPPYVGGHWVPQMLAAAGGEDVAGRPGAKSREARWEELRELEPDVVVAMPCGWDARRALEEARAHAADLEELGAPRVVAVDAAASFSRPGPRLVDGVELLAHVLHPGELDAPGGVAFAELGSPARRGR